MGGVTVMICQSRLAIEARVVWQRSKDLLTTDDPAKRMATVNAISNDIYTNRIKHPLTVQLEKTACHISAERVIAENSECVQLKKCGVE